MGTTPPPLIQWRRENGRTVPDWDATRLADEQWIAANRRYGIGVSMAVALAAVAVFIILVTRTLERLP